MRFGITSLFIAGIILSACGQKAHQITEKNVTRIISALADDDLMGRDTFSPGIEKAAEIISNEFKEIGLEKIAGEDDYFQEFEMYSVKIEELSVTVNGSRLDDVMFATSEAENFVINDLSQVQLITADENFGQRFSQTRNQDSDVLILVDKAHKNMMSRYAGYFGRPSMKFEMGEGSTSTVYALYSGEKVESVEAKGKTVLQKLPLKNVAGMIKGKRSKEFILFSAHYDHIGIRKAVDGDSIANGANDDASGTTAVIELARYYKSLGTPERSLLFVAFTAEEKGGFGSKYFSSQLNPDEIVAMFNIEMIGKPAVEGPNTAWITGFDKSDFGSLLQKSAEGSVYTFYPDPYPDQNLFYRSDNATLASLGVPAHSISTTPIDVDKDYHKVSDEVSTLDLPHLTNTIKAIATGALGMVDGSLTPTRVDPAKMN